MWKTPTVFLVLVLAAACTTSKSVVKPTQEVLERRGVEAGDVVVLRSRNAHDPNSSSRSTVVRIETIGSDGVVGTNQDGEIVAALYDELFGVEIKESGYGGMPGGEAGSSAISDISRAAFLVACAFVGAAC